MSKLPPFPQALIAGALAALVTSVLIWLATVGEVFAMLNVAVAAPGDPTVWTVKRMMWGALAGLLFLAPLLTATAQWKRGLLVSLVPIAVLLLVIYPRGHEGWFGLNLGVPLLAAVIVLWLLWGVLAGWMLTRWGFWGVPVPEGEETPPE